MSVNVLSQLRVSIGGYSQQGGKPENQDAFAALLPKGQELRHKGVIAAIADGVSSAKYAKQAAQLTVTDFIQQYRQTPQSWSTPKAAAKVLGGLNHWLFAQDGEHFSHGQHNWLTTFSALVLKSNRLFIFHCGDSRVCRLRGGVIEPLTREHSSNNILTRALGASDHLELDCYNNELEADDIFVLTTDGVHEWLTSAQLSTLIEQYTDLEQAAAAITEAALAAGSPDNLTCLLVRVDALPDKTLNDVYTDLMRRKVPPVLAVGQKLDGYRILRTLHASSRSHLYLAKQAEAERPVVLKIPSLNFADDPIYLQGFLREAWVGQQIKHPNVMPVLSAAENSPFLYHVCEFIQGQPLSEWMLENPKPTISQVRSIVSQVIQALRAFQRMEMVHRDLKPDNLIIDEHGQVTLVDYGSVAVASCQEDSQQLQEFYPQGSADYCAPESLLQMQADFRSDMYALGCICYEMLCGQLPYKPGSHRNQHYHQWQYRSIKTFRKDIPLWLDLALAQATAAKPEQRFNALSEFQKAISLPDTEAEAEYRQQPLLKRNPVLFWQSISLILLIIFFVSHSL